MAKRIQSQSIEPRNTDIVIGGNRYVLTDFPNQWTIKQNRTATRILATTFTSAFQNVDENDATSSGVGMMASLLSSETDAELLAVIYLDEGEEHFNLDTYEARKRAFESADGLRQSVLDEAMASFFDSGVLSTANATRIFSVIAKPS